MQTFSIDSRSTIIDTFISVKGITGLVKHIGRVRTAAGITACVATIINDQTGQPCGVLLVDGVTMFSAA